MDGETTMAQGPRLVRTVFTLALTAAVTRFSFEVIEVSGDGFCIYIEAPREAVAGAWLGYLALVMLAARSLPSQLKHRWPPVLIGTIVGPLPLWWTNDLDSTPVVAAYVYLFALPTLGLLLTGALRSSAQRIPSWIWFVVAAVSLLVWWQFVPDYANCQTGD